MRLWSQGVLHLRWQDAADISVLTFGLALVYRWLRDSVAIQAALAIASVLVGAWLARQLDLRMTSAALSALSAISAVAVVVIFKDEIRRGLSRVNPSAWWRRRGARNGSSDLEAIAQAMFVLAPLKIGALVVIPRRDDLADQKTGGCIVDALLTPALLETIFTSGGPLHDGAVIVQSGRVVHAGVVLPLSTAEVPESFGTRHRAALGLSEVSDAVIVCVSEERGEVSVAADGIMTEVGDAAGLIATLARLSVDSERRKMKAADADAERGDVRRRRYVVDTFAYLAIFVGAVGAWSATALEGSRSLARSVALEFRGLDDRIGFDPPADSTVIVELRGPERLLDVLPPNRITAFIDLSRATPGRRLFPVSASAPDGVKVVSVIPASVEMDVLERREIAVQVSGADRLRPGLRIVAVVPNRVQLAGSASAFRGIDVIQTEPLRQAVSPGNVEVGLTVPKGLRLVDSKQERVLVAIVPVRTRS